MRSVPFRLAWVATVAFMLPAGVALAEPGDLAAAETLFRQGRASVEAGDYLHACPAFAESLRLDPAPGTLFNLADCEEHIGHLASARANFVRVESVLPSTDERRAIAHDRAVLLEPRIPRLTITLDPQAPGDAMVFRDDVEVDRSHLGAPLPVDPGPHNVLVVASGRESSNETVVAVEREVVRVVASPGPVVAHDALRPPSRRAASHTAAWIVGAGAIASLGIGTYFGGRAIGERSTSDAGCSRGVCSPVGLGAYESARSDARVADVALGIGVVALAVTGYLLLTSRGDTPATAALLVSGSGVGGTW